MATWVTEKTRVNFKTAQREHEDSGHFERHAQHDMTLKMPAILKGVSAHQDAMRFGMPGERFRRYPGALGQERAEDHGRERLAVRIHTVSISPVVSLIPALACRAMQVSLDGACDS